MSKKIIFYTIFLGSIVLFFEQQLCTAPLSIENKHQLIDFCTGATIGTLCRMTETYLYNYIKVLTLQQNLLAHNNIVFAQSTGVKKMQMLCQFENKKTIDTLRFVILVSCYTQGPKLKQLMETIYKKFDTKNQSNDPPTQKKTQNQWSYCFGFWLPFIATLL